MSEKLVRDHIPQIMRDQGIKPNIRRASSEEMSGLLRQKLVEEAMELMNAATPQQQTEEMADVLEVIMALIVCNGVRIRYFELDAVRQQKLTTRGGFSEGWVLISDDTPAPPSASSAE